MNAYQRLLGAGNAMGQIEIMGDAAALVTEADKGIVTYTEQGYKVADKTYVGLGLATGIIMNPPLGLDITLNQPVVTPFKPLLLVIPSWAAPGVMVVGCQIGPTQLIDGQPIPADAFTEVANSSSFSWPTVEMSQSITLVLRNTNPVVPDPFNIAFYGIRLRK
jgi:hypothetical protein